VPPERRTSLERWALVCYLATVVALTSVHDVRLLGAALVLTLALAGRQAPWLIRRMVLAVGPFCLVVSVSYAVLTIPPGQFSGGYLVLINLRVAALTTLTFLVMERVNLARALGFSRGLLYILTLATSQALTLRRVFEDYRLALRSRTLVRLGLGDRYRHSGASAARLLAKAMHRSGEIALAMRARGFFDSDPPR
jgi:cobalt/nickel transport system permease protein